MTGRRLDAPDSVIKSVHAKSGVDCIVLCLQEDPSCRSANFKKTETCGEIRNCELLKTVDSEEPAGSLKEDADFDYYILVNPDRVSTLKIFQN